MKNQIKVIILPLYYSNSKYNIYEYNKTNKNHLEIVKADELLSDLSNNFNISQIDIIGGEISLLSDFYFDMLYNLCKIYSKKINVYTNFIKVNKSIINNCTSLNVICNFNEFNTDIEQVFHNINATDKTINLKSLDVSCIKNPDKIIGMLNNTNIKSFEIIPSRFINFKSYEFFENVVKIYLDKVKLMKFAFQNKLQLDNVLPIDNYNTEKIFIIPDGKYALQQFINNKPDLLEFDNILNLKEELDKMEKISTIYCKKCNSKLVCMSNYFFDMSYDNVSCCGFKNLIEQYKQRSK